MRKEIMQDGNSFKLRLTKKELRLYGLKVGDVIEVEFVKVKKK